MPYHKKLLVPSVAVLFIASFAFAIINSFKPVYEILTINSTILYDSLDNNETNSVQDVSQMFNERGYYKSNSFSFDENEIINDFNGNLMYEIPLYSFNIGGEVPLDVKLTYNGSVGHEVFIGTETYYGQGKAGRYNINAPEWILSVNGLAVQIFNFETNFFTKPDGSETELSGNELNMIIPGYHTDDRLLPTLSDRDRLYIMAGDGSNIALLNTVADQDTGTYEYEGKEMYYKAHVIYSEPSGTYLFRNRRVELMKGDGLIYIYEERKVKYYDFDVVNSGVTASRRPQTLLLMRIADQFGHVIMFNYEAVPVGLGSYEIGRPLLSSISSFNTNIQLVYGPTLVRIENHSDVNGTYNCYMTQVNYYQGDVNHVGMVNKIVNINQEEAIIAYSNYSREYTDVQTLAYPYPQEFVLRFDNFKRISSFKNFLGGRRGYEYLGGSPISIDVSAFSNGLHMHSGGVGDTGTTYKGYGRDAFYTNMTTLRRDTVDGVVKSQHQLAYYYTYSGSFEDYPIDSNETYSSKRIIESLDGSTVNYSSDYIMYIRSYKVYGLKPIELPMSEKIDVDASTKLSQEDVYAEGNSGSNFELRTNYSYEKGTNDNGLTGSMLMTQKAVTSPGLSPRVWKYDYTYLGSNYNKPVTFRRETDPKGIKFETTYDTFSVDIKFNAFYGFNDFHYYKFGVPLMEEKYESSNRIFKKTYDYIHDTAASIGYYGQLDTVKVYNESGFSYYLQTTYRYYKRDTLGTAAWSGTGERPMIEGNLKVLKSPDGTEEEYYYYPVYRTENKYDPGTSHTNEEELDYAPNRPRVSYKIKYSNGTVRDTSEFVFDVRLPSRISKYNDAGRTSALSTVYMMYNDAGNPVKIINENRFLTQLTYQATHRIRTITLPGDFSTAPDTTILIIDTNYLTDTFTVVSEGWGHYDDADDKAYYANNPSVFKQIYCPNLFSLDITNIGGNTNKYAFLRFNANIIPPFTSIGSAVLDVAPISYTHTVGGSTDPQYIDTKVQAVYSLAYNDAMICVGTYNTVYLKYYASLQNYTKDVTIPYDNSGGCDYDHAYLDVKDVLDNLSANNRRLWGMVIKTQVDDEYEGESPNYNFDMNFVNCSGYDPGSWLQNYAPRLKIYGTMNLTDTLRIINPAGGTYIYDYDDVNHYITVRSRLTHGTAAIFKQVRYRIDGYGNVKQKDIFRNYEDYDSLHFKFNFTNSPSHNFEAYNRDTRFSYDELNRIIRTDNPILDTSNSRTEMEYSYQSSLSSYFGSSYSGFVEKQQFKDETGRIFNKYFDAVGNLLREEKFVAGDGNGNIEAEDNPFDPDTTYEGQDVPGQTITLYTDYQYDKNYRLIKVKTPDSLFITYWYDGYGRQIQRMTPDASYTKYTYDNKGNLIYTQDAKQRAVSSTKWSQRAYDKLNRLLVIGEVNKTGGLERDESSGPLEDTTSPVLELDVPGLSSDSMYVINVYDTLSTAVVDIFNSNKPSDYYSTLNYTHGNLVSTAYRTRFGESWDFKFYRYDARGRVMKMWHYIQGLGWKSEVYDYNSQNQLTRNWYQPSAGYYDSKLFTYGYDSAARFQYTNLYVGGSPEEPEEYSDAPGDYKTLTKYWYNENSQVEWHKLNENKLSTQYMYNGRGWLKTTVQAASIFRYTLLYNLNGNIRIQAINGNYSGSFADATDLRYTFVYDQSNRLLKADRDSAAVTPTHDIINSYDRDGNLNTLKRYGINKNLVDNYSYQYFSGTNRLKKVGGGLTDDYTYDDNGNMTKDEINRNYSVVYDYRNLMTEIRTIRPGGGLLGDITYYTKYWYDEAGNRVRKQHWQYTGGDPDPPFDLSGDTPPWTQVSIEFYVRDVSGREKALYSDTALTRWNIWGLDMIGHMNLDTTKYYYLKDHLGSIRATISSTNSLVSAQDFDAWGYLLQNRGYNAVSIKYDYTGKERDNESNYDYFGARYYDSRIGRWGGVDSLFMKHYDFSPYNYVLVNPLTYIDPNGKQVDYRAKFALEKLGEEITPLFNLAEKTHADIIEGSKKGAKSTENIIKEEVGGFIVQEVLTIVATYTGTEIILSPEMIAIIAGLIITTTETDVPDKDSYEKYKKENYKFYEEVKKMYEDKENKNKHTHGHKSYGTQDPDK